MSGELVMDQDDWEVEDLLSGEFYAQVILTLSGDASTPVPLLADPRWAALVAREIEACAPDAPGRCWGYVVIPDAVRLVVGQTTQSALEAFVEQVKARTTRRLMDALSRQEADTLDCLLRYNPVRGGVDCRVWQAGMQRILLWSEYRLSNALYDLRQAPIVAGLASCAETWPFMGCMEITG